MTYDELSRALVTTTNALTQTKKQLEDLTAKYYDVKRQNEERAEIIRDLLTVIEVDTKKLKAQLERRCEDDGK